MKTKNNKVVELIFFSDNFLVISKPAQKKAETTQIKIVI